MTTTDLAIYVMAATTVIDSIINIIERFL